MYDVVIAGAGPVGLFLACELRLANLSVLVLEQAANPHSPLKQLPFGMRGLSAPTIEAFYRRGLLNDIAAPQPAKIGSTSTAAHWMHTFTFALLMLGAAALARRFGGSGALVAAGIIAIPAAFGQSWLAYDDVFAASLMVAACVLVMATADTRSLWAGGV